jgi:hypothetical protein
MGSSFASVTAVFPTAQGRFDATVDGAWTIAGKPNGGYLLALLGRAAAGSGTHPHPIAASATYLRPPEPGPVEIETEVLRAGRTAGQVRARMLQNGAACVEALITTSTLDAAAEPYWTAGLPVAEVADLEHCVRVPAVSPLGMPVPIMDEVTLHLDPADTGFARGKPSGRGQLRGWLALPDDAPFDPVSLLYAVDAFPPATFEIAATGWVPTLELTVYVRALPAPGPVRILHRAQVVDGEKVDEACFVWDSRRRLVAQGTQLAGIRLG